MESTPAIGSAGTVYVGSWDKTLYAINGKTGVKQWEIDTGGVVRSSPAIGPDGTVYVGSSDKKLYAFRTDSKGLAKSPWPMRGQNPQHTGRTIAVADLPVVKTEPGSLPPKQVADLFAEDVGTWKIKGKAMPVGSVPETFEDTMEIRWKEEGKSTTATFSAVINGKEVRFIGHKEYDAAKGEFIWRSKGEGLPETSSRETYDPKKKTYHGKSSFPDGAEETSTLEIVSKDKRLFKTQVKVDGKLVFSREATFTRITEDTTIVGPAEPANSLADNIIGKRIVCLVPGNLQMLLQFEKDGTFNVARIVAGKIQTEDDELTYVVDGLNAKVKQMGEDDGGVTFTSTNPKKGDQITFGPAKRQMASTILRIELAAPFEEGTTTNPEPTPPEPNVNQKGLIAYYPFNGNACDESGNGHGGKVIGAKLTVDRLGKADSAYQFELGDHIRIDGLMGKPKNLTLSAWFKLEGPQGRMGSEIISLGVSASIRVDSKSTYTQRVGTGGVTRMQPNGWMNTLAKFNYTGTGWHQIVFTFDDDADRQVTYVDGKQMVLKENQRSIVYEGQETDTVIGIHGRDMETWRSQGKIDDIRVYDRALSAEEVKALFKNEKPSTPLEAGKEIKVITVAELRAKAQAGDPKAQLSLGLKIINAADGLKKNPAMTENWWLRAAKQGHTIAQMNLGLLYSRGGLGEKHPIKAYQWAKLSLMRGNQRAKQLVETLEKELTPEQIAEAEKFIRSFKPVKEKGAEEYASKPDKATETKDTSGLSKKDIERIAALPHQPITNTPQFVTAVLKPGMWERNGRVEVQKTPEQEARGIDRKLTKKIKHVKGKYVVIETTDEKDVKLLTEVHSYDPLKKAMYSTSVNARGLLIRLVGFPIPNTRTVHWKSGPNEPFTQELSITCAQDGLSAQLVGKMHREGTLISTFTGVLKRVSDLPKSILEPTNPDPTAPAKKF